MKLLQNINQALNDGIREFSEHPVKYSLNSLKGLIREGYDAGIAVGAGLAWTQYGESIYGEHQITAMLYGPILTAATSLLGRNQSEGSNAFYRNMALGLTTFFVGNDISAKEGVFSELFYKTFEVFFGSIAVSSELFRREDKRKLSQNNNRTLENSLVNNTS